MRQMSRLAAVLLAAILVSGGAYSEDQPAANPERERAFELYKQGKLVEAMPLLEKLSASNPKDAAVMESLGACVLGYAQTLSNPEIKKATRARARSILVKAQELGDHSDFLQVMLRQLPEDGSFSSFSDKKDVDEAMQAAEGDFARGDLEKARQGYMRAFLLDGKQYYAALFIGDTYYKQKHAAFAGQWFAQAINIDPNKETAYRYWGDALLADQRLDQARSKYIDAIIADPYNPTSWNGLKNWLTRTKETANWLKLQDGVAVTMKDGKTNVTLNSNLPGSLTAAWLIYGMNHSLWMTEKFKKEFPKESEYRHTLKEENEGLEMFIEALSNAKDKKQDKDSAALLNTLKRIQDGGFLEVFALLNRADAGLAQDYAAYREANREKIRRYFNELVLPKTPSWSLDAGSK